ncbi:Tyrosyl-DNA phosphodiesterase 2 [Ophiophagus hannah]|uniref:Tyrosyl-DNA phosphodiesterase 2 n=1 Tax=Ophiophagus hannah TaxID=8665 RepID=V8PEX4_OPHHA|nr:Tyrosyl-DNA phosphodiesterase 2 [Ophiophagus hannah]
MEGGWAGREVEQAASEAKERQRVDSAEEGGPREDLEEQRKRLCLDFASISNSGAAAAERYLAENGWDMQKALNSYFDPPPEQDVDGMPHPVPTTGAPVELTDHSATNTVAAAGICPQDDSTFSLITWNIDGLDSNNLQERARGVNISGNDLCLMTSHLESTKDHSEERLKQLKLVLAKMAEVPESSSVIFGGDTNLRDKEVAKIGGLPNSVLDIWEFLGKPEHCRYTWDTSQNSNLNARYKCKSRFDRLFFRGATAGGQIIPQNLDLIGLEKLDCGRFPSDHWGLFCNFDVIL